MSAAKTPIETGDKTRFRNGVQKRAMKTADVAGKPQHPRLRGRNGVNYVCFECILCDYVNKGVREGCCVFGVRSGGNIMNYVGFECILCGNVNKGAREGCCVLGVRSGGNMMNYAGFECILCGYVKKDVREGVGGADIATVAVAMSAAETPIENTGDIATEALQCPVVKILDIHMSIKKRVNIRWKNMSIKKRENTRYTYEYKKA
jgi:hypothetical protein